MNLIERLNEFKRGYGLGSRLAFGEPVYVGALNKYIEKNLPTKPFIQGFNISSKKNLHIGYENFINILAIDHKRAYLDGVYTKVGKNGTTKYPFKHTYRPN